ncbi:MAG TPA: tetratricopeptide repeat protein [Vicinamibacterales bacterium]|nr:tetratricopeptide repeat protein [Vicinamibacterales bacterium]
MRFAGSSRAATIVCLTACLGASVWIDRVATVSAQSRSSETPLSRIDRLRAWIAAVNAHEPGFLDEPVEQINRWSAADLQRVWIDVWSVVSLVRDPGVRLFLVPAGRTVVRRPGTLTPPSAKPIQVTYSGSELKALIEFAASLGGPRSGRETQLLKRGAMLHADIAMLAPLDPRRLRGYSSAGAQRYRLNMNDGRPTGLDSEINHWELGRRLLDRVRVVDAKGGVPRGPEADETVRLWYIATFTHLESIGDLDVPHFDYGLEVFPKDPDILLLNGAMHESMAGARRQRAFRSASIPAGVIFAIGSRSDELAQAERLYRRALEAAPDLVEARIRYGRVLGERGRHQEAAMELQKAAGTRSPLLQYYCALFLGAELEALGRNDEAVRAYERAAGLYPGAQSPRLGINRLAAGSQRAVAREALLSLVAQPVDDTRIDPWWAYDESIGRGADVVLNTLHNLVRAGR